MEQMISLFIGAISTIVLGVITNSIYDKIKNHSNANKSGCEFSFEFKLLEIKFKRK